MRHREGFHRHFGLAGNGKLLTIADRARPGIELNQAVAPRGLT
jgi:hypothetical protein